MLYISVRARACLMESHHCTPPIAWSQFNHCTATVWPYRLASCYPMFSCCVSFAQLIYCPFQFLISESRMARRSLFSLIMSWCFLRCSLNVEIFASAAVIFRLMSTATSFIAFIRKFSRVCLDNLVPAGRLTAVPGLFWSANSFFLAIMSCSTMELARWRRAASLLDASARASSAIDHQL